MEDCERGTALSHHTLQQHHPVAKILRLPHLAVAQPPRHSRPRRAARPRFKKLAVHIGDRADVEAYGRCAAAQYALDQGFGFARQVRTIVKKDGRTWYGDAVYLISASLPEGLRTVDAEVALTDCDELGIPAK